MERVTSEAGRDRSGQRQAQRHLRTAKRSATSSLSREETAQRRHQRQKAESDGEAEGAATATLEETRFKYVASLWGEEAAVEFLKTRPTRCWSTRTKRTLSTTKIGRPWKAVTGTPKRGSVSKSCGSGGTF